MYEAGVEVFGGYKKRRGKELLHSWLTSVKNNRPYYIAKIASTLDGKVAAADGSSKWITGDVSRKYSHQIRATVDAIVVGTGTVKADNPSLTARPESEISISKQPLRVVVGESPLPLNVAVASQDNKFFHFRSRDLLELGNQLLSRDARRVLIEGGPTLISAAIKLGIVDEYHFYIAGKLLGSGLASLQDIGVTALEAAVQLEIRSVEQLGNDVLIKAISRIGK